MTDRPNIIFILPDQHRLSGVGAYGETPCRTPNIDRLAAEGALFENAYTVYWIRDGIILKRRTAFR